MRGTDVEIENINESFIQVNCSESIAYELREVYSFTVPGAHFSSKFKSKLWDGKIRLFSVPKRRLYRGLANNLCSYLEQNKYSCHYNNPTIEFSVKEANDFISSLSPQNTPYDYQLETFIHCIRNKRAIILSPTGSGKSFSFYLLARKLLTTHSKGLMLVPKVSLVEQMYTDFEFYVGDGWNVSENVHRLYEGKEKHTKLPLTISTWQSIFEMPKNYFEQFDFIFGDEAHQFAAKSLCKVLESAVNSSYRIGMTGTLDGKIVNELVQEGLFGPVKQVATSKELIDRKILSDIIIKCLILKHDSEVCKSARKWTYQDEIKYLINSESRNKFICNLANSLEDNTLVLFNEIEHGKTLYESISKNTTSSVYFVYGKTDVEIREEIREIVEKEKGAKIVASYGVFSIGVNIKNIHNIIFARSSKARVRILQSIGRGLRTSDSKSIVTIFDISDDLRYNNRSKENYTLKHYMERINMYAEEQYKFKNYNIELKG